VLAAYLRRSGLAKRVAQVGVIEAWPRVVGPEIARAATAESVSADGVLFVRVRSSAWRQELSLMTPAIIAGLNAGRRSGRIKGIRWLNA
jgi:predicted nucleic acid-binding Zn ribbon protein